MAKATGLASRFDLASETPRRRTIATLDGEVGTGKTYFALTAGGPSVVFNLDQGLEAVVEQFRKEGKEIYDQPYVWIPGDPAEVEDEAEAKDLQDLAKDIRSQFEKDFDYALNNGARTLILDTESRFWQVYRYAEFGAPNADNPRNYDELNQRFEAFINKAKARDVNLFLIRAMKDKWGAFGAPNAQGKKGFGKGGREVWGYEHLAGLVMMELTFVHDREAEEYKIRFGKCRHNKDLAFTEIPRCTFPELGTMLDYESDESDWA